MLGDFGIKSSSAGSENLIVFINSAYFVSSLNCV